jgi:transketolase
MSTGDATAKVLEEPLARKSLRYRRNMLQIIKHAGAGHTGGGLSCIDILNVLYNRVLRVTPQTFSDPRRDRYIQSKGHCVEALYVVLADRGFFPPSALSALCQYQSHFVGHPTRKVPGIEQNTGALGHGLSLAVGTALGCKLDQLGNRVFTLLGDGELAEGSNWEAAMSAAHHGLDNLVAIVDRNTLQISGRTRDVCNSEPLAMKFAAFGWHVTTVGGHDLEALSAALSAAPLDGKPTAILADTIKGRGISFMEDVAKWHHGVPNDQEYERALEEIDAAIARLA